MEVKGNCHYQRVLVLSIGVIYSAASTFIVGLGFFLAPPKFICEDGSHCSASTACSQGHYELDKNSIHSMVYEWKLVCEDEYQTSLIGSLYFVGLTIGSILIGRLTDAFGRQRTCLYCLVLLGATLLLGAFSPSPVYIDIVSVVSGAIEAVLSVAAYLLLNEMLSSDLRSWYSGLAFAFWSGGTMIVALLFLVLDDWRKVMIVCSMIPFIAIPSTLCQPESIRWLVVNKHRVETATKVAKRLAKANKIDPETIRLHPMLESQEEMQDSSSTLMSGYKGLFSSKKMRLRLFGINFLWIAVNVAYYGALMCVTSYNGNVYINGVLLGLGETLPNLIMGKVADHIKRKTVIIVSCLLGCLASMLSWLLGEIGCGSACDWPSMGILLLAMVCIDCFYLLIYIFTSELFPTKVRGAGYSMCNTTSRLGGLLASNLLLIQQDVGIHPLLIIAGSLLASVFPVLTLPETLGQPLLDYNS